MVQMALVMPILIFMFSAIVQFGGLFFLQNQMVNAARDASRRLAVGDVTASQAEALVQANLANWPHTFTVTAVEPDGSDPADTDVSIDVSVPRAEASMMDILGMFRDGDLTVRVVMRQE